MPRNERASMDDDLSMIGLLVLILWLAFFLADAIGAAGISEVFIWTLLVIAVILLVGGHILDKLGKALNK